ncbi:hypothetical protein E2C01_073032 [Portunus trituberculatus]|uniref:Uncharacterized protein n=1 Tax=Portunus trituberculatus TaxID=210409 RepID=A0A5B7ICZ9_PORTR|nr:hypothetical protein [Portunus trituberculatus]
MITRKSWRRNGSSGMNVVLRCGLGGRVRRLKRCLTETPTLPTVMECAGWSSGRRSSLD